MKYDELIQPAVVQGSLEWFRFRQDKFNGSEVGDIMKKGRSKTDKWGETAKSYMCSVRSKRTLDPDILNDDERYGDYINETQRETLDMIRGKKLEWQAASYFLDRLQDDWIFGDTFGGLPMRECGSCQHHELPFYASSPDRLLVDGKGEIICCCEIKCPRENNHALYTASIHNAAELKKVRPLYYWQCQSHMAVTGAQGCFFVWYSRFQYIKTEYILVPRNDEEIAELLERIKEAHEIVNRGCNELYRTAPVGAGTVAGAA